MIINDNISNLNLRIRYQNRETYPIHFHHQKPHRCPYQYRNRWPTDQKSQTSLLTLPLFWFHHPKWAFDHHCFLKNRNIYILSVWL